MLIVVKEIFILGFIWGFVVNLEMFILGSMDDFLILTGFLIKWESVLFTSYKY